jgi:rhamnogalacturonyl hydrolase YesR
MQLIFPKILQNASLMFFAALCALLAPPYMACAAPAAYHTAVLANKPYVYYEFGEVSGTTAIDSSVNGFNGTYVGGVTMGVAGDDSGGGSDTAVTFDGSTGYASVGTGAEAFGSYLASSSYEFVFKTTSTTTAETLIGTANMGSTITAQVWLNENSSGTLTADSIRLYIRDSSGKAYQAAFTNAAVFNGAYNHLVWTFTNSTATAYVDGVVQALTVTAGTPATFGPFAYPISFGCYDSRGTNEDYAAATMDEAAIYTNALSAAQVTAHYNALNGPAALLAGANYYMSPQTQILSDMVLANNRFTNEWETPGCSSCLSGGHPSCIWTRGTYFEGSLALYRINHDTNIYNYAVQWGVFTNWNLRYGDTDNSPDDQCAGQEYVELYQLDTSQTNRLTHIVNNVNFWMSGNVGLSAWTYVDSIHMSMPAFAKLGVLNSNVISTLKTNATYLPMMFTNFNAIKSIYGRSNGLYNATDHLWWRDTNFLANYTASDGTTQKCYWSRGNGWAFVALARTMDVLPTNDTHYAEYLQTFQQMAPAIKTVQRADGFWNANLAYTNDYPGPESSGTACFVYGMAWGINHGYLDANTYLPAVIAGWNALAVGALHHSNDTTNGPGFLGYEQGSGDEPASGQPVTYTSVPDFDDFGLGLFLLAGSQVYQLSALPGIVLTTPVLIGNQVQLNFTVITSQTNGTLQLLQTGQLGANWTTNSAATLTTNIAGLSYCFTTTNNQSAQFYQVLLDP